MEGIGKYKNLIAAIIVISVFAWGAKKMFDDYQVKRQELQERKQTIIKGKELIDRWDRVTREYDALAVKFFRQDPAVFKRFVEDTAQNSDVVINSSNIAKEEKGQFLYVTLSIKSQSSYRNLIRFVKAIEGKLVSVQQVLLQKRPEGGIAQDIVVKGFVLK